MPAIVTGRMLQTASADEPRPEHEKGKALEKD
jgi:hypothetical protein